jgi:hypothetical protein
MKTWLKMNIFISGNQIEDVENQSSSFALFFQEKKKLCPMLSAAKTRSSTYWENK